MRIIPSEERSIAVPSEEQFNFTLEKEEVPVVTSSGGQTEETVDDAVFDRETGATVRYDAQLFLTQTSGSPIYLNPFESGDESIATVNDTGRVTTVGTGNVTIYVRSKLLTRAVMHDARTEGGQTQDQFNRYADGTAAKSVVDTTDGLINTGGGFPLYSTRNHATSTFVRSASVWTGGCDWTGVSPSNNNSPYRGGTLVSPRHLIWANHFNISSGRTILFVTQDNEIVSRTIQNSIAIANSDIRVGALNADVPETIKFYKVLPTDWMDYIVTIQDGTFPIVAMNQFQEVFCREQISRFEFSVTHQFPQAEPRSNFGKNIIYLDSGQPMFMVFTGNEPVFLGVHYTSTGGPLISGKTTEVNAAMTTLGGGYQLTPYDLSGFTNFST